MPFKINRGSRRKQTELPSRPVIDNEELGLSTAENEPKTERPKRVMPASPTEKKGILSRIFKG